MITKPSKCYIKHKNSISASIRFWPKWMPSIKSKSDNVFKVDTIFPIHLLFYFTDLKNKLIHCTRCNKTWDYPKKAVTKCLLCKSALMYKCRACISKIYSSARSLEGHLYRYHNKREEFHCDQCNYKTYAKNYLRHHIVTRHLPLDPNSQNKCENCGKTYSFRSGLTYHLKTCGQPVSKLVSLICDDCGYKCRQKNQLVRHVQSKHLNETYECTACGKSFKSESNLFEHSRYSCKNSANSKRLSCRLCVFKFASEVHLQNHMQTRHKNVSKSSSKLRSVKKKLNLTSRVQTNNPPRYLNMRKCRKCGKSYANGSSFRAHVTVCSEPIS